MLLRLGSRGEEGGTSRLGSGEDRIHLLTLSYIIGQGNLTKARPLRGKMGILGVRRSPIQGKYHASCLQECYVRVPGTRRAPPSALIIEVPGPCQISDAQGDDVLDVNAATGLLGDREKSRRHHG
jgi:hypothetical protein